MKSRVWERKISRKFAVTVSMMALLTLDGVAYASTIDGLEEITVTARRRTETLLEVPISLSVITSRDLSARGITRVNDLLSSIPNVSLSNAAGSVSAGNIVIRGISTNARNVGFESGVSVYVDGVFTGRPATFNQDLLDIERIEVLRGPQGTLFGKNTIAGAINITSIRPGDELEGKFTGEFGNLDYWNINAVGNIPVSDQLALRVQALRKKRDGTVDNLADGDEYNDEDNYGFRIQSLFKPNESLDILLSADYSKDDRKQSFPEVLDGTEGGPFPSNAPGKRTVRNDFPTFEIRELWGAALNIDWVLENGGKITAISGYRDTKTDVSNDNDNSSLDVLSAHFNNDIWQFSQEIRYASPSSEWLDYVVGAYYFRQAAEQINRGVFGADFLALFNIPTQLVTDALGTVKTTSYAVFADAQVHITPELDLLLGARYTYERKKLAFEQQSQAPFALPNYAPFADRFSDDAFSPMAGLSYAAMEDLNIYAKVAKGFKSGGWNADFLGQPNPPVFDPTNDPATIRFSPETVVSYESGLKWASADNRFSSNVAVFYSDYKNLQVSQFLGVLNGGTIITNAAKATLKGIEVDFRALPVDQLEISGGAGYLSAKFDDYADCAGVGIDCDNLRLPNAPKWTANLAVSYTVPVSNWGEATARADYSYRGSVFATPDNQARLKAEDFNLVDLSVTLADIDGAWQVTGWVNNVFDKDYIAGIVDDVLFNNVFGTARTLVGYGLPRTYGVRTTLRF